MAPKNPIGDEDILSGEAVEKARASLPDSKNSPSSDIGMAKKEGRKIL